MESMKKSRSSKLSPGDSLKPKCKKTVVIEPAKLDMFTEPLYNEDGSRNTKVPFELYVIRKNEEERQKNKKQIVVSKATKRDTAAFNIALKRLNHERSRSIAQRKKYLKALEKARSVDKPVLSKVPDPEKYPCPRLPCTKDRKRSRSRSFVPDKGDSKVVRKKPVIKYPKLKTKPWKSPLEKSDEYICDEDGNCVKKKPSRYPVIVIPPFKTRKWVPKTLNKPKPKVVIEYPPVTLRSKPWKPKERRCKRKVYKVEQLHYKTPASTLGKTWHSFKFITCKTQILCGKISQYSKKFSFTSNGKQSAFISTVAICTADIWKMQYWKSCVLDEIVTYGDINFRRHVNQLKHKSVIKPSDVYHKIYLKYAKVLVEIGELIVKGIFDPDHVADIKSHVVDMLDKFSALIFLYNGQSFAMWREEKAYYIFNSEDTNEKGKLVEKSRGGCCVLRSGSLPTIVDYLIDTFRVAKHLYEIYSFRVNSKVLIHDLESPPKKPQYEAVPEPNDPCATVPEPEIPPKVEPPIKTGLAAVLFRHTTEPTFGDNYLQSTLPNHAFITCPNYLPRELKNRASYVSSVAIVMLQICKSSLWMSATLEKIFQVGHKVYVENVEKLIIKREMREMELLKALEPEPEELEVVEDEDFEEEEELDGDEEIPNDTIREKRRERMQKSTRSIRARPDIPITEIRPVVSLGKSKYELAVETLNIGKVISKNPEELSLEAGIRNLFKHYDYGLIIGTDVVSVWRENNRYFMFDPNMCKEFSRAKENDEQPLNSCLHCFENIRDLVQLYTDNLAKTYRKSTYKICKIDTHDFMERSSNWQEFKAIGQNKWILCGSISESADEFNEGNRNHQSTCISVVALAKSRELGIPSWTTQTIDDIVRTGDEYYAACVHVLKEKEVLENPDLTITEILTELRLNNVVVDLSFEESTVYGKLYGSGSSFVPLVNGLKMFFKNDDLGVLTACNVSLGMIKLNDGYFLFDSHARDEFGRNFNTLDPINACKVKGTACMIKFLSIEDLSNHLMANLEVTDSPFYSISKVDVSVRSSEAPCLHNYRPFGEEKYCAILMAFDKFHEDVDQYKCPPNEKTLCNIMSCLSYATMYNPRHWESNDINEILKIGWKILCKISKNLASDVWDELKSIEVCAIKLSLEAVEEQKGIFKQREPLLESETKLETVQDQIEFSTLDQSVNTEQESIDEAEIPNQERSSTMEPRQTIEKYPTLLDLLKNMENSSKVYAYLSSSLFALAIFKIDGFFYAFDPKASMDGMLVRKRLEDFIRIHLVEEHNQLLQKLKESKRKSKDEEGSSPSSETLMEELIFGRQVVFGSPSMKLSEQEMVTSKSYADLDDDKSPINISEKGSAYVAWFTTPELLYQHVLNKIPEKFFDEKFTLKTIAISKEAKEVEEASKWNNFEKIAENQWICRGNISQNDPQFPTAHRNNQDVANCIMALAFKTFCGNADWNSTVLDVILKFGDRLFKKSLALKLRNGPVHASELKLRFADMDLPIFIRPYVIQCTIQVEAKDFAVKATDKVPLEKLKEVVKTFLCGKISTGFLVCKNYYAAIWKSDDNAFMMFDPHDIGPDGLRKATGLACLQRFTDHAQLVEVFWMNVKDLDGLNEYELVCVNTDMTHYKDGEEDVFESMNQESDKPVMPKIIHAQSTSACTERVEMSICYAVAAHCLCQALDSEYYTSDIIDRIIMFGNELVNECCTNDEVCFKDFNLNKHTSCPDEINWNFKLNDTFTTVQMDIFRRGVISKQPCPVPNLIFILEQFFEFHCSGVMVTNEFIVAMWKDKKEFFIFYSCPINGRGIKRNDKFGKAGLVILKSVHDVFSNMIQNIRQQTLAFELRICNIQMTDNVENQATKKCEPKICKKKSRRKVASAREEVIMPAVAFRENDVDKPVDEVDNAFAEHAELLKKQKPCDQGFIRYSRGGFMCGKLSKDSKNMNETSRMYHSPAICLYAACMHSIINMNCWTSDVIDCVILSGNNLHIESSILCGTLKVDITSVMTPVYIDDNEIMAKAESCIDIVKDEFKSNYVLSIICELMSCYRCCFVGQSLNMWLLAKSDTLYFLFDPRGIEVPGKKMSRHYAALYRFDKMGCLIDQLMDCVKDGGSSDAVRIGGILISTQKENTEKRAKSSLERRSLTFKGTESRESKPVLNIRLQQLQQDSFVDDN